MTALTMLIAVVTTLVVTRMVLGYASRRLLDQVNERSSHVAPTPRGGGLGLVVGLLVAWTTGLLLMGMWTAGAAGVGASVAALALLGWWDDHAGLSARTRLPLHLAAAAAVVWIIGLPDSVTIGIWTFAMPLWIMAPLAVIAATWLVNLTNFMDGIDGIAGSQGLIAGIAAAVVFASQPTWHLLGMATAGACLGFLWWNRPPARIFMGDVGSTALGLVFACFVLVQIRAGHSFDLALLPLTPFVLDATCTLFRRLWRRERASVAHRSHLYQRLSQHWGAHLPVTALYAGLALVGAAGAWAVNQGWVHPLLATTVAIGAFTACAMYGRRVAPA